MRKCASNSPRVITKPSRFLTALSSIQTVLHLQQMMAISFSQMGLELKVHAGASQKDFPVVVGFRLSTLPLHVHAYICLRIDQLLRPRWLHVLLPQMTGRSKMPSIKSLLHITHGLQQALQKTCIDKMHYVKELQVIAACSIQSTTHRSPRCDRILFCGSCPHLLFSGASPPGPFLAFNH